MELLFTPGAQRALIEAAAWSSGIGLAELEAPALLLGLLSESECRAALVLTQLAIDQETVRGKWPELTRCDAPVPGESACILDLDRPEAIRKHLPRFSDELLIAMGVIRRRFRDYPPPLMLATEHLLLGLAGSGREVSAWLAARGLNSAALETEILRRHGYEEERGEQAVGSRQTGEAGRGNGEEGGEQWDERGEGSQNDSLLTASSATANEELEETLSPCLAGDLAPRGNAISEEATPHTAPLAASTSQRMATLRVLDAAANRAMEGLRVAEDYVRFALDDRHLTEQLKRLRHALAAALELVPLPLRLAARDTQADVGTALTTPSEQSRPALADVLSANLARAQEALRSLEEFGKLLDTRLAAEAKQLRYQTYTVQRAVEITRTSRDRLSHARLYVLIDGASSPEALAARVRLLVENGVHVLQLRDKQLDDRTLLARARLLRELTAGSGTLFIVNDRPDLALLAHADGVHVGQEELTVKDARAVVGPEALVGVSTHSLAQARQAVLDGANYVGVGPTFPSGTKQFDQFPGLELLQAVAAEIRLPAFAIGGIAPENLSQVLGTGMSRIAVSGAVTKASDPAAAARELLAMLRK